MINSLSKQTNILYFLLVLSLGAVTACRESAPGLASGDAPMPTGEEGAAAVGTPAPATPEPTLTPLPTPTPTPQLAALVNGQPILLEEFERELARLGLAQAQQDQPEDQDAMRARVLSALIDQELIGQAAAVEGIAVTPQTVEAKIAELRAVGNESGSFDEWLAANLYTEDEFREALTAELITEEMAALVTADVPERMEHLHVRYIQLDEPGLAESVLAQIREGADFAGLAQTYSLDRVTGPFGGDLGWFTRGSLLVPEIETAAFALDEGEVSDVISAIDPQSERTTYYIIQLLERDPNRLMTSDLRHRLLQEAFDSWLETQRAGASVVSFIDAQG